MAAGAPSSLLPTAMLRLWTRATALEVAGGVHNGARDAALQAAVDLLAAGPPPMCAPGPGASQYELAVAMKESHAWLRLKARLRLPCFFVFLFVVLPVLSCLAFELCVSWCWEEWLDLALPICRRAVVFSPF